ncbi:GSCFA domain-containing protein [Flagellimonas allohymeniacidonis]|uniref:GSCFA domain-containing protein n=1 Tax=Flagellimonas allohymeniacidonis TaxID=2517819 RepID=A0A4Q8QEC7_9FLAO|nr:GSCFA domain-containing protein [Allomuricauda hymeniacidonis]TAI48114.1 GSCFA domain-containing protein [Allomuricauda hymeniacidonis]
MKLQTSVPIFEANTPIDYKGQVILIGSCFAENIGEKFRYYQFQSLRNPFGILFQPLAIQNLLERSISEKEYSGDEVFYHQERWHCFEAHSSLSQNTKHELIAQLNLGLKETKDSLQSASHVVITLGTAWVYQHKEFNFPVANCHKIPQLEFDKRLLDVGTIANSLKRIVELVHTVSSKAKCILTVSPVRHLKDGFVENQRSKAYLIAAVHQVLHENHVSYFPSYEIMMDELRDYRYYERDMVHPNALAVDIIWNAFKTSWISKEAQSVMEEVEAIRKGLSHRPFNPDSEANKAFQKSVDAKISYIKERYPFMKFE